MRVLLVIIPVLAVVAITGVAVSRITYQDLSFIRNASVIGLSVAMLPMLGRISVAGIFAFITLTMSGLGFGYFDLATLINYGDMNGVTTVYIINVFILFGAVFGSSRGRPGLVFGPVGGYVGGFVGSIFVKIAQMIPYFNFLQ
ncbi:hypothetical protein CRE_12263 [Caenorhabditis remanei]|uniref:Uncharacterized protein n=1 Tax=Caenorhabditis remanei TaxID=31234 RepID=E3N718_CAERE|nr:hypothetical protein CRE_12263 [Caenorhabditis remanei]